MAGLMAQTAFVDQVYDGHVMKKVRQVTELIAWVSDEV